MYPFARHMASKTSNRTSNILFQYTVFNYCLRHAMFNSADHDMKVHMKEKFRQFVYPETTSMVPPPNKVACKGAPKGWSKRPSYSQEERSTKRQLSQSEHAEADAEWADRQLSQPSQPRRKSSRQSSQSSPHPTRAASPTHNWPMAKLLPIFMHPFIENVIDVTPDGHCGFCAVSGFIGDKNQDDFQMIRLDLSIELRAHKERYVQLYGGMKRYTVIETALVPCKIGPALEDKWMMMPDMGFFIAQKYNSAVVLLTGNGWSETYFSLEGAPPYKEKLMCIGWVNENHFMQLYFSPDSPLPPPSKMWLKDHLPSADKWPNRFASRMETYTKLQRAHEDKVVREISRTYIDLGVDSLGDEPVDLSHD
ncbi:protein FAR1-RELATED SEQUENCE 5 [Trifolium medium]|uniref:Protein FAR1-RELATED SEQUENCE 5 n=1 Tax=Trifolium medium TaxID=97028 RepID=A0A392ME77_9FABA|nr:protein FAR1-RELATED SEQUENCE 5 [Trifolium medium]